MNATRLSSPRRMVLALLGLFLLACAGLTGSPVPDTHQDYIGVWQGIGIEMTIAPGGRLEYENNTGSMGKSISAPIQTWGPDYFEAGLGPMTTRFEVNEPPHIADDGGWEMTVDGHTLDRVR